jgi:hypothetical protein
LLTQRGSDAPGRYDYSLRRKQTCQIVLTQLGAVHADRVATNIHECANLVPFQGCDDIGYFPTRIAKREKIGFSFGTEFVPDVPTVDLLLERGTRKVQPICLWHKHSVTHRSDHLMIPLASLFRFKPISRSRRCTHLSFGNFSGSFAAVLISVHVRGPDVFITSPILSRKLS